MHTVPEPRWSLTDMSLAFKGVPWVPCRPSGIWRSAGHTTPETWLRSSSTRTPSVAAPAPLLHPASRPLPSLPICYLPLPFPGPHALASATPCPPYQLDDVASVRGRVACAVVPCKPHEVVLALAAVEPGVRLPHVPAYRHVLHRRTFG